MKLDKELWDHTHRMFKYTEVVRTETGAEIPPQQMLLLYLIALNPGINQADIPKLIGMPTGTVSRNVVKLRFTRVIEPDGESRSFGYGYVEARHEDATDSRKMSLYLTERGLTLLKNLSKTLFK